MSFKAIKELPNGAELEITFTDCGLMPTGMYRSLWSVSGSIVQSEIDAHLVEANGAGVRLTEDIAHLARYLSDAGFFPSMLDAQRWITEELL